MILQSNECAPNTDDKKYFGKNGSDMNFKPWNVFDIYWLYTITLKRKQALLHWVAFVHYCF